MTQLEREAGRRKARRARTVLPRARDGQLRRQFCEVMRDEAAVELFTRSHELYPVPLPIALTGMRVAPGGEFVGGPDAIQAKNFRRLARRRIRRRPWHAIYSGERGGFASLSDLISEATTGGKMQQRNFHKIGTTAVAGVANTLWYVGPLPGAGANPAALAAGTIPVNTTVGSLGQTDAAGPDSLHITTLSAYPTTGGSFMLLADLLWYGQLTMNSTGAQSITGVPTRYTGAAAVGNLPQMFVRTALPATAHNINFQYVDNAGNTAESGPQATGVSSAIANRHDSANWFLPLNVADLGARNLTQVTISALVASGQLDMHLIHPLAWIPLPGGAVPVVLDGINSAFNLVEILDGACLTLQELRSTTTAATYTGMVEMVSG